MTPQNEENKSNAGRKTGTKNKQGSQKPGPKPKHLKNQHSLSQFFSPSLTNTTGSNVSDLIQDQPNAVLTEYSDVLPENFSDTEQVLYIIFIDKQSYLY
jgi:hypothetical protein